MDRREFKGQFLNKKPQKLTSAEYTHGFQHNINLWLQCLYSSGQSGSSYRILLCILRTHVFWPKLSGKKNLAF